MNTVTNTKAQGANYPAPTPGYLRALAFEHRVRQRDLAQELRLHRVYLNDLLNDRSRLLPERARQIELGIFKIAAQRHRGSHARHSETGSVAR
jgi:hypothetical protein